jgi:hypothetical protein
MVGWEAQLHLQLQITVRTHHLMVLLLLEEQEEFVKVLPLQTGAVVVVEVVENITQQTQQDLVV